MQTTPCRTHQTRCLLPPSSSSRTSPRMGMHLRAHHCLRHWAPNQDPDRCTCKTVQIEHQRTTKSERHVRDTSDIWGSFGRFWSLSFLFLAVYRQWWLAYRQWWLALSFSSGKLLVLIAFRASHETCKCVLSCACAVQYAALNECVAECVVQTGRGSMSARSVNAESDNESNHRLPKSGSTTVFTGAG